MFDRNKVQRIKAQYPAGTRVRLNHMDDPQAVPAGTEGTVLMVDDAGQLVMQWDNGRSLSLIPGEDAFSVIHQTRKEETTMEMGGLGR